MRILFFLLFCAFYVRTHAKECVETTKECDTTDYKSYVECIRRPKRSINCDSSCEGSNCNDSCDDCDCDSCSASSCEGSCQSCCSSCCNVIKPTCSNNHCCHKKCHATCKSSSCRSSCRKSCYESVKQVVPPQQIIERPSKEAHNITTIIHLNNVLNNTNLIDVPIILNNTNINNIPISSQYLPFSEKEKTIVNTPDAKNCCMVISPRQCVPHDTFPFVKCFHYRSQQCGPFCNSPIVHVEPHNVCDTTQTGPPKCNQQLMYIPQPQPRCVYKSYWPYVSCGIANQQQASCEGCYNHYVDPTSNAFKKCSYSCYDDGFGAGPAYRQGPFYRPNYSHVPPCYQQGTCNQIPPYFNDIGNGLNGEIAGGNPLPMYSGNPMYSGMNVNPMQNPLFNNINNLDNLDNLNNPVLKNLVYGTNGSHVMILEPPQEPVDMDVFAQNYNNPLSPDKITREVSIEAQVDTDEELKVEEQSE